VAWFDFAALCASNRAANDYIALADRFDTLIIANVPQLIDGHNDAAKRFMHLIDEAYDRGVKVVMSAACPANELYAGHRLKTGFDRTTSRLLEMQSLAYLESARR
jgi:cell division protein ZapE